MKFNDWWNNHNVFYRDVDEQMAKRIFISVIYEINKEREACADLAFSLAPNDESACEISAAIRMRSNV